MVIYSVTVSVDRETETEWLFWMREIHIPDVMRAGYFDGYHMRKVIDPISSDGRPTYNIEYTCLSKARYDEYLANAAEMLQQEHRDRFDGQFTASRSVLGTVD